MSVNVHNKKRNSLLMYEFLIKTISRALFENNKHHQKIAMKILKRCYKPGSELYKEWRLANAIYKTTVSSPSTATSILDETKYLVRRLDKDKLEREKSILIREVNHRLSDDSFYDQSINDYKTFATIQVLFNEWIDKDNIQIEKLAEYEDKISKWLIRNVEQIGKLSEQKNVESEIDPGTTRLVSKLINQKFNDKYASLTTEQRAIVRSFVLSEINKDNVINTYLEDVRKKLLKKIEDSQIIDEKINEVKQTLISENITDVNIDTITRFLLYSHLTDEIGGGNNDK